MEIVTRRNREMSQRSSEIEDYVRRLGKLIIDINSKLTEISRRIDEMEQSMTKLKADQTNSSNTTAELKIATVQKAEFDEFVNRLTDSLKGLIPLAETAEAPQEEMS